MLSPSAAKPTNRSKTILERQSAIEKEIVNDLPPFPFKTDISLEPLLRFWESQAENGHGSYADFAKSLLEEVAQVPVMQGVISTEKLPLLEPHQDLIENLFSAFSPVGTRESDLMAACMPYGNDKIFATPSLLRYFAFGPAMAKILSKEEFKYMYQVQSLHSYITILKHFYNEEIQLPASVVMSLKDPETHLPAYFQLTHSNVFVDIKLNGELPILSKDDVCNMRANPTDLSLWKSLLPPAHFSFEGVALLRLFDVSENRAISNVKYKLLEKNVLKDADKFKGLEDEIKTLLNLPELAVGITAFQGEIGPSQCLHMSIVKSFTAEFVAEKEMSAEDPFYQQFQKTQQAVIIEDLNSHRLGDSKVIDKLKAKGYQSLIFAPLFSEGKIVGLIELLDKNPRTLSPRALNRMEDILPIFSIAIEKEFELTEIRISEIIREECTAIHPSVSWRFRAAAQEVIDKQDKGEDPEFPSIVFDDVYPLYAAVDVRSSSTQRNKAIQEDLIETLEEVKKIINIAIKNKPMPILRNFRFRTNEIIKRISQGIGSADELIVKDFLNIELAPLVLFAESEDTELSAAVEQLMAKVDPELGLVYHRRQAFEDSLTKINLEVSHYLEGASTAAQKVFPHYFEKFQTDGVEYNIYLGDSMHEKKEYNPVYLKNLRLWQLQTTCEIAQLTYHLEDKLPVPLRTTQLILVHSNPMAIRFRTEEKHFDVDGAYNIRYEIIKKRIDKSKIKGTEERLTQPGKIAIVYSNNREAIEYREYIKYLQAEGCLGDEIESLDLEDLQGVKGLRALRVSVKLYD